MPFIRTWNTTYEGQPADGEDALIGASRIRNLKVDVRERLDVDHSWLGDNNDGKHQQLSLRPLSVDPIVVTDEAFLYSKLVSGDPELFYRDDVNAVFQLTGKGGIRANQLGHTNIVAPFDNLKITRPSVSSVSVTANSLILDDGSFNQRLVTTVSSTASITSSGAGGLDAGSEAASTWYHIYAIAKLDGTKSIILSTSAIAPTLPSGYIFYGYVGAVRNDAGSNFVDFFQRGVEAERTIETVLTGGSATAGPTLISLSTAVPDTAVHCHMRGKLTTTAAPNNVNATLYTSSAGFAARTVIGGRLESTLGTIFAVFSSFLITAQSVWYDVNLATTDFDLNVHGYSF